MKGVFGVKINDISSYNIGYTSSSGRTRQKENSSKLGKFDVVLINKAKEYEDKRGKSVDEIKEHMKEQLEAPSDAEKVSELKMRVENGDYEINSIELARILLSM